jgi:beta-lactamase superfamily II metal-dependent hydrolase
MAWELEIHHIDVVTAGDATLIIAKDVVSDAIVQQRAVLIDGGRAENSKLLAEYVFDKLGENQKLHAIVSTHYDEDHLLGLTNILAMKDDKAEQVFGKTHIFDQGWWFPLDKKINNYVNAINTFDKRNRVTAKVLSAPYQNSQISYYDSMKPKLPAIPSQTELLNTTEKFYKINNFEILWCGVAEKHIPSDAPRLKCIAVNCFVFDGIKSNYYPKSVTKNDPNANSIACLLTFNNFRYYIGGDIESEQEAEIAKYVSPNDELKNRMTAIKTSHHGANTATSRSFVDQLQPVAAFISCGEHQKYGHPAIETNNVLDGFQKYLPGDFIEVHPKVLIPPRRPIRQFLTSYAEAYGNINKGGTYSETAGNDTNYGDIILRVSNEQSKCLPEGRRIKLIEIAVLRMLQEYETKKNTSEIKLLCEKLKILLVKYSSASAVAASLISLYFNIDPKLVRLVSLITSASEAVYDAYKQKADDDKILNVAKVVLADNTIGFNELNIKNMINVVKTNSKDIFHAGEIGLPGFKDSIKKNLDLEDWQLDVIAKSHTFGHLYPTITNRQITYEIFNLSKRQDDEIGLTAALAFAVSTFVAAERDIFAMINTYKDILSLIHKNDSTYIEKKLSRFNEYLFKEPDLGKTENGFFNVAYTTWDKGDVNRTIY